MYKVRIKGVVSPDDGFKKEFPASGWEDCQTGECPDCGGTWIWSEDLGGPGTRLCQKCGSLFNCKPVNGGSARIVRERLFT